MLPATPQVTKPFVADRRVGVKQSGWGREGLRYAIREMTEPRLLVLSLR